MGVRCRRGGGGGGGIGWVRAFLEWGSGWVNGWVNGLVNGLWDCGARKRVDAMLDTYLGFCSEFISSTSEK